MSKIRENILNKNRIFPLIGAIIVFVLCFSVLYMGENVGLSDNGDFRRVLLVNNLEYKDETDHYYLFKQDYKMKIEGDTFGEMLASTWATDEENNIYTSPHFVIIKISKSMNFIMNYIKDRDVTEYNIAYLAGIYIFMLSMAAWCIFTFFQGKPVKLQIAVFALFLLIFCDAGYILYFNSFYGEPLQYVSIMLIIAIGLLMYLRPSIPKVICLYISLYFFAGSKLVNVPYAIIVSLLALCIMFLRGDRRFKVTVAVCAAVSIGFTIKLYTDIPDWMQQDTTYQSVFFGILKESGTPDKDLEELGIDSKYSVLSNTHAYMNGDEYPIDITSDEFADEFYGEISKAKILFFYLRHPSRLFDKLCLSIENSAYIRPPNVGNSSETIMEMTNKYSLWSNLRVLLKFFYQPIVIFILFILISAYILFANIYAVIAFKEKKSGQRIYMIGAFDALLIGIWLNLILPVLCNGEADLPKHMFLFISYMDILFSVLVLGIVKMKPLNKIPVLAVTALLAGIFYISPPKRIVEFGTYNGEPVKWEVAEELNDNSLILVTKDCVSDRRFDGENNMWETSELRSWLSTEFLNEFTEEEKAKIMPSVNEVILAANDKAAAAAGDHTHYWNCTKDRAGDLSKTAYHYYLEDRVYIPTLDLIKELNNGSSYWVLCPYAGNDKMERYMKYDGYVLHTNVNNVKGVRAVIKYDNSKDNLLY